MLTGLCSQTFAVGNEERQCEHRAIAECHICGKPVCGHCLDYEKIPGAFAVYSDHVLCPQCAEEENSE